MTLFYLNEKTHFDQTIPKKKLRRLIVWYCSSSSTFGPKKTAQVTIFKAFNASSLHQI
jgi:hypothetical protein